MSVTFYMPEAPTRRVQPYKDEPDLWVTEPVPPFTELNLANGNARDFLEMFGCDSNELCGSWSVAECRRILTAVVDLARTDKKAVLLEPTIEGRSAVEAGFSDMAVVATNQLGLTGCTFIHCGRDMSYVEDRLEQFRVLLETAIRHGYEVAYA